MNTGRRRPWPLLIGAMMALVLAACSTPATQQPDPSPVTQTTASTPDYQAMGEAIEKTITAGSLTLDTVGAVLINADGQTVLTHYRNGRKPDEAEHVFSVTKSVLSALVGIAREEGLIKDLDAPLRELLPTHQAQLKGELGEVTLRQLMTMTAGFPDDDTESSSFGDAIRQDGDAVDFILEGGLTTAPGETFAYSNASTHLVSAILTQALSQADGSNPRSVLDYATEKLFIPLGIDTRRPYEARFEPDDPAPFDRAGFGWATDAQGINIGAGQLRLRPADLLKFGQLYLDRGRWQGKQLIPEPWVEASVTPSPVTSRYGLLWWVEKTPSGDAAYAARGFGGQLVVVVPEHQLVVVVTSQPTPDWATDSNAVFALISDTVLINFP